MPQKKKIMEKKQKAVSKQGKMAVKPAVKKTPGTSERPQQLKGVKDILPKDQRYWERVREVAKGFANAYGFGRLDPPLLEKADLFIRSEGEGSDIVQKEMYVFKDPGGEETIALRPEFTPSMVRAYYEHGFTHKPQPVKFYTMGPVFRHDKPQSGRYRQFHQVNYEVLGSQHPIVDAEMILLAHSFFAELGLQTVIQINSIGTPESRGKYIKVLVDYFKNHKAGLSEQDRERLLSNPLRVLDSKDEESQEVLAEVPQILDFLDEESKADFMKVLEYLDGAGVSYNLNPRLVRGLDYYTRTTFEVWTQEEEGGRTSALAGGGRYDGLASALGLAPLSAIGFALGVERTINAMREKNIVPGDPYAPEVYVTQLGEAARKKALSLIEKLRTSGVRIAEGLAKDGLRPQLEQAGKLGVQFAIILGQKEILDGTIIIRDMENGVQEIVAQERVVEEIAKRVQKRNMEKDAQDRQVVDRIDESVLEQNDTDDAEEDLTT